MVGKRISHYEVVEKLGEGGMGAVYRAKDTSLGRDVALKFLSPDALSSDADKARFIQEARSAAALDHPNICTIYEICEDDGEMFIAMAFVEGANLRDMIDRGPIGVESALDLAIQVADGLSAAHEKGIIHRDIKSANVMVNQRGQARVMDFGLAKLAGASRVSKEPSTAGTVAYMSPEQARGDEVDTRTDIWSLGVVMYEMLTGARPFRGDYEQSVIYAIVNEDPEPLTARRSGIPAEFGRIVTKAMSKRLKQRYQTMQELLDDLRSLKADLDSKTLLSRAVRHHAGARVRTFAVPTIILALIGVISLAAYLRSGLQEAEGALIPIAVADFENTTGEPQLDGLSGMLITALEQSRRLSVLTRSSMIDIARQVGRDGIARIDEETGREICRRMNIDVLVTASIRSFDDLYTIDLKAYRMGTPGHLFTAREEGRGRASIPGMVDRIAQKTRKGLNEESSHIIATSERVADVITPNLDAYQQFFEGEEFIEHLRFKEAQAAFSRAIDIDSTFALAHYRLAYANWWGGESEDIQRAQLEKALALIERLPEKFRYLLRAQNAVSEEGYEEGVRILKEMEKIYPDDMEMIYNIGDYSFHAKEYEQAESYLKRVLEVDPEHARALNHLGMTYAAMQKSDEAIAVATRYANLTKTDYAYMTLSNAYLSSGDKETALEVAVNARTQMPENPLIRRQIATVLCAREDYAEAKSILDSLTSVKLEPRMQKMVAYGLIGANLYAGRYREALESAAGLAELSLAEGDTATATLGYQLHGIIHAWGWGDTESAAGDFEKARTLFGRAASPEGKEWAKEYWSNWATLELLSDRFDRAREIAEEHLGGDTAAYDRVRFFGAWKDGDYHRALAIADSLLRGNEDKTILRYYLALARIEQGHFDDARRTLKDLQTDPHYGGPRPMFYVPSYYLAGLSYEREGNPQAALASYGRFLDLWRGADRDLTLLVDAQRRAAELESAATQ